MLHTVPSFWFTARGMARSYGRTFRFACALGHIATDLTGLGDVTGLGERRHIGNDSTDLERHIDDLVSHVEMEDLKKCHNVWSGNADQTRAH